MSLKVYFKIALFATIISLVYIHMQMKIYELSYKGKDKEHLIHELNDSNGALSHQILTLKSANNIGAALLDRDKSLEFMDNQHQQVMKVITTPGAMQRLKEEPKPANPVWNLLSFLGAQEAKAWE